MKDETDLNNIQKFRVGNSKFGKGCFANETIKIGEFICFCGGREVSWEEQERRFLDGEDRLDDPLQISENKYIELEKPYIYFNHSCNPNSGIRGKNELIAIKNINPGEEIVYDYSSVVWDERWVKEHGPWNMKCGCKERNCRKVIGDFLTIPKSLRRKYIAFGVVPDFILKRLLKEKNSPNLSGDLENKMSIM